MHCFLPHWIPHWSFQSKAFRQMFSLGADCVGGNLFDTSFSYCLTSFFSFFLSSSIYFSILCFFFFLRGGPYPVVQCLLLVLCSWIIIGGVEGTICDARNTSGVRTLILCSLPGNLSYFLPLFFIVLEK